MSATKRAVLESPVAVTSIEALRRQYACGAVDLTGNPHALYERHLFFDNVMHPAAAGLRERYEAIARSLRDVLSQRGSAPSRPTQQPQTRPGEARQHPRADRALLHAARRAQGPGYRAGASVVAAAVSPPMSWACGGMVRREILRPVLLRRLKHRRRPIQRLSMEFLIGRSLA